MRVASRNHRGCHAALGGRLSARNRKNGGGGRILRTGDSRPLSIACLCLPREVSLFLPRGNDRLQEERAKRKVRKDEADHRVSRDVNHDIMRAVGSSVGTLIEVTSMARKAGQILGRLHVAPRQTFPPCLLVSLSSLLLTSLSLFIFSVSAFRTTN